MNFSSLKKWFIFLWEQNGNNSNILDKTVFVSEIFKGRYYSESCYYLHLNVVPKKYLNSRQGNRILVPFLEERIESAYTFDEIRKSVHQKNQSIIEAEKKSWTLDLPDIAQFPNNFYSDLDQLSREFTKKQIRSDIGKFIPKKVTYVSSKDCESFSFPYETKTPLLQREKYNQIWIPDNNGTRKRYGFISFGEDNFYIRERNIGAIAPIADYAMHFIRQRFDKKIVAEDKVDYETVVLRLSSPEEELFELRKVLGEFKQFYEEHHYQVGRRSIEQEILSKERLKKDQERQEELKKWRKV